MIPVGAEYFVPETNISWSPTGRYVVFSAMVRDLQSRSEWKAYDEPMVRQVFEANAFRGRISPLQQYLLFDTKAQLLNPLLDAPVINAFDKFFWAKDGQSIFLSSYLPLNASKEAERNAREQKKYLAQVMLPSREYRTVRTEDFPSEEVRKPPLEVSVVQGLNAPPKLYVSDTTGQRKTLLLTPLQFSHLEFGTVKVMEWTVDGVPVIGGLYLLPTMCPGSIIPWSSKHTVSCQMSFPWTGARNGAVDSRHARLQLRRFSSCRAGNLRIHETTSGSPQIASSVQRRRRRS